MDSKSELKTKLFYEAFGALCIVLTAGLGTVNCLRLSLSVIGSPSSLALQEPVFFIEFGISLLIALVALMGYQIRRFGVVLMCVVSFGASLSLYTTLRIHNAKELGLIALVYAAGLFLTLIKKR